MKKLKNDFDCCPKDINWKRKKILAACTEADLNVNLNLYSNYTVVLAAIDCNYHSRK